MEMKKETIELAGQSLTLETGQMAKQSSGSVVLTYGDTVILVAVNSDKNPREGIDFFPLSVEYRERAYAAGKIPGGFFRREGRPSEKEILASRLTDRPIRPLFPDGFRCETQVMINLLSTDQENPADILGTLGASVALMLSDIPWNGPIAAVRVGMIEGKPVLNPTYSQLEESALDLVLTGGEDAIVMMEGEASEITEEDLMTAVQYGHEAIKDIIKFQKSFVKGVSKPKREIVAVEVDEKLVKSVTDRLNGRIETIAHGDKDERRSALDAVKDEITEALAEEFPEQERVIKAMISDKMKQALRSRIVNERQRPDGRGESDIRDISIQEGVLPRAHGSALFTRGETQSLATVTLGSKSDEQFVDDIDGEFKKHYMLHYNFPPFSVGEVRRYLGVSRREVGHGNLAERALEQVMPKPEEFPYTVRVVSDILESNGSSSMATVCSGSLALMNAGVPIKAAVSGISVGLVTDGDKSVLLTDILGEEDHYGDMDFKVAGTRDGITSVQVDLKIDGLSMDLITQSLERAKAGRFHILDVMDEHLSNPHETVSQYAPKILRTEINPEKIGELIGPGGRNIRAIIKECECEVEVDDDGVVVLTSPVLENCQKALKMVEAMMMEPEVGAIFEGPVRRILNFGAFIELAPGKEGLLHISEISHYRTEKVEDEVKIGDVVKVKIIKVDDTGRFDVSKKALTERPKDLPPPRPRSQGRNRQSGNRHSRHRDRNRPQGKRNHPGTGSR